MKLPSSFSPVPMLTYLLPDFRTKMQKRRGIPVGVKQLILLVSQSGHAAAELIFKTNFSNLLSSKKAGIGVLNLPEGAGSWRQESESPEEDWVWTWPMRFAEEGA
jgi:hypothetical protein